MHSTRQINTRLVQDLYDCESTFPAGQRFRGCAAVCSRIPAAVAEELSTVFDCSGTPNGFKH